MVGILGIYLYVKYCSNNYNISIYIYIYIYIYIGLNVGLFILENLKNI